MSKLTKLQQAAKQLDANFRQFKDSGDIKYQKSVGDTLEVICKYLHKKTGVPFAARGAGGIAPADYVQLEETEARNLLDAERIDDAIAAYLRALPVAADAITACQSVIKENNWLWPAVDTLLSGLAKCADKLPMLEIAEQLNECALIVGQQGLGRKSLAVYNSRLALSQVYLEAYLKTKNIKLLSQAARHGVIAVEMSYIVGLTPGHVLVASSYSQYATGNLEQIVNTAPGHLPIEMFYLKTLISTLHVAICRQLDPNVTSYKPAIDPPRH